MEFVDVILAVIGAALAGFVLGCRVGYRVALEDVEAEEGGL
jgi:hypothetical protein